MYLISKDFHWSMGHALAKNKDKCFRPHGHNYVAKISVSHREGELLLPKENMVLDFADLGAIINGEIERLDHNFVYNHQDRRKVSFARIGGLSWIDITEDKKNTEPTAEGIAKHLALHTRNGLTAKCLYDLVIRVDVQETPKCVASFLLSE